MDFGDIGRGESNSVVPLSTSSTSRISQDLSQSSRNFATNASAAGVHTKYTFRPIDQVQQTVDPRKMRREHGLNLESLKRDEHMTEVNLRQLVSMDFEPMSFLQAWQGSYIVTTNEYLRREPQQFEETGQFNLDEEHHVMMFQIIGVPGLNQRAREVPPFKSSLTTSGLYMLISRLRIQFWAGSEFFACYLSDNWTEDHQNVIGEELLTKLVYIYDQSQSLNFFEDDEEEKESKPIGFDDKKVSYYIEGCETEVWHRYMGDAQEDFQERM